PLSRRREARGRRRAAREGVPLPDLHAPLARLPAPSLAGEGSAGAAARDAPQPELLCAADRRVAHGGRGSFSQDFMSTSSGDVDAVVAALAASRKYRHVAPAAL